MAFLNGSLLFGGLLIAAPIVLHLMMRAKPKHVLFPAVRFIKQRQESNTRQLQLRHWLLLALRCAAIAIPALALARPRVASAALSSWTAVGLAGFAFLIAAALTAAVVFKGTSRAVTWGFGGTAVLLGGVLLFFVGKALTGPGVALGSQEAPVAAVLVIDTSARMNYRHENRTRLEQAKELARWLLTQFPADSEVAVISNRSSGAVFAIDRSSASQTIDRLQASGRTTPLPELVASALGLLKKNDKLRKELYIFSDLTSSAWRGSSAAAVKPDDDVLTYVLDVGVERPHNARLGDLQLSSQMLAPNAELRIQVPVSALGLTGSRELELVIEEPDPRFPVVRDGKTEFAPATRRGVQTVDLSEGKPQAAEFRIRGLEQGVHQGEVRLIGGDALPIDDVRYFTVEVQPPQEVLLVTGPGVSAEYVAEAIAPREFRQTNQARFLPEVVGQEQLAAQNLNDYRAVVLLNPAPLQSPAWEKLADYVERGGNAAFFLGHHATPAGFGEETARKLLGGKLARQSRTAGDVYFAPQTYDHPLLAEFRRIDANVPWNKFPIYYHWNLKDLGSDARVIAAFGNQQPALLENRFGRGRTLTMTTPITDPLRPRGRPTWNELPTGEDAWPCFVLVNEIMLYLVQSGDARLNYLCGETAVLPNDAGPDRYQLFTPSEQPQDVTPRDGRLTVRFTEHPGGYRLRGQQGGPVLRGFAVNLPADDTDLARVTPEQLHPALGERFHLAKNQEEIDRAVGSARVGSEFYPLLMAMVALIFGLEHVLANRFYRGRE